MARRGSGVSGASGMNAAPGLFTNTVSTAPLAHRLRPRTLDEYVGQRQLFTPGTPVYDAIERGVLLRPLGSVVYAMPPLCTSDESLQRIVDAIKSATQTT